MRVLGIDVGRRRVGLAISDPTGTLARPLDDADGRQRRRCARARRGRGRAAGGRGRWAVGDRRRPAVAGSTGRRPTRPPATTAFIEALRARTALPVVTGDERLTSREAESRLALRERDWRKRKAQARRGGGRGHPAGLSGQRRGEEALFSCVSCCSWLLAGAAGWFYLRVHAAATAATRAASSSSRFPPAPGSRDDRRSPGRRPASSATRSRFALALWLSGKARRLKAGEYRFDSPMTPLDVIDKIARGDVYVHHPHVSRRPDDRRDGEDLRDARLRPGAAFVGGRDASRHSRARSGAPDLEGYLFPDTYPLPRRTDAAKLVRHDGRALRARR